MLECFLNTCLLLHPSSYLTKRVRWKTRINSRWVSMSFLISWQSHNPFRESLFPLRKSSFICTPHYVLRVQEKEGKRERESSSDYLPSISAAISSLSLFDNECMCVSLFPRPFLLIVHFWQGEEDRERERRRLKYVVNSKAPSISLSLLRACACFVLFLAPFTV